MTPEPVPEPSEETPDEQPPDEQPPEEEPREEEPRRYPRTLGGMLYLVVLAATLVGLVIANRGSWRDGVCWIGGALIFAALVRSVLRGRDAGMLAVRNRFVDAMMMAVVGGLLIFLALTIPDQPV
ncbi:DUF3017 domain-containing protein [Nocardioides pacificus]